MKVKEKEIAGLRFWMMDRTDDDGAHPWQDGLLRISRASHSIEDHLVEVQWSTKSKLWLFDISYDAMEFDIGTSVGLGLLFVSASVPTLRKPFREALGAALQKAAKTDSYEGVHVLRISAHNGGLWWEFLHPSMSWKRGTPKWRYNVFYPLDAILGERKHLRAEEVSTREVDIPMPEGSYRWTVQLLNRYYGRKRLPWERVIKTYNAECHEGHQIPKPGKGENAWDCGPDATFGQAGPGHDIGKIIGDIVGSSLHDRLRRGAPPTYSEEGLYDEKRPQA